VDRTVGVADGNTVKRRPTHETRAARARRDFWKRLGVWIFIVFFALTVAGGLIVVSTQLTSSR
jgi:hypothetical protein